MVLSMLIAIAAAPALLGSQEAIRQGQSKDKKEEHRARRCNLIANCIKSSNKSRDIDGRPIVLKDNKLWIDTGTSDGAPFGHPYAGYYLPYPDEQYEGLVTTITDEAPILNWVYVHKDTHEVKYGIRADAQPNRTGPFDCTRQDRRLTFDGWEGFCAVEEKPNMWALYFDADDDGLQTKVVPGMRVLELELTRKEKRWHKDAEARQQDQTTKRAVESKEDAPTEKGLKVTPEFNPPGVLNTAPAVAPEPFPIPKTIFVDPEPGPEPEVAVIPEPETDSKKPKMPSMTGGLKATLERAATKPAGPLTSPVFIPEPFPIPQTLFTEPIYQPEPELATIPESEPVQQRPKMPSQTGGLLANSGRAAAQRAVPPEPQQSRPETPPPAYTATPDRPNQTSLSNDEIELPQAAEPAAPPLAPPAPLMSRPPVLQNDSAITSGRPPSQSPPLGPSPTEVKTPSPPGSVTSRSSLQSPGGKRITPKLNRNSGTRAMFQAQMFEAMSQKSADPPVRSSKRYSNTGSTFSDVSDSRVTEDFMSTFGEGRPDSMALTAYALGYASSPKPQQQQAPTSYFDPAVSVGRNISPERPDRFPSPPVNTSTTPKRIPPARPPRPPTLFDDPAISMAGLDPSGKRPPAPALPPAQSITPASDPAIFGADMERRSPTASALRERSFAREGSPRQRQTLSRKPSFGASSSRQPPRDPLPPLPSGSRDRRPLSPPEMAMNQSSASPDQRRPIRRRKDNSPEQRRPSASREPERRPSGSRDDRRPSASRELERRPSGTREPERRPSAREPERRPSASRNPSDIRRERDRPSSSPERSRRPPPKSRNPSERQTRERSDTAGSSSSQSRFPSRSTNTSMPSPAPGRNSMAATMSTGVRTAMAERMTPSPPPPPIPQDFGGGGGVRRDMIRSNSSLFREIDDLMMPSGMVGRTGSRGQRERDERGDRREDRGGNGDRGLRRGVPSRAPLRRREDEDRGDGGRRR